MSLNVKQLPARFASLFVLFAVAAFVPPDLLAADKPIAQTTPSRKLRAEVAGREELPASEMDPHDVSVLTSEIMLHVNDAADEVLDEDPAAARESLAKARQLIDLIRPALPVTVTTTLVKDESGNEIYSETRRLAEERIPIFKESIAVRVVEPLIEAHKREAAIKGGRLVDADFIDHTAWVDLGVVDRKIARAQKLLKDKDIKSAAFELALAQRDGVKFLTSTRSDPLNAAMEALGLAEKMVRRNEFEAARENLVSAKLKLGLYRDVIKDSVDLGDNPKVSELQKNIEDLETKLREPGAIEKIRQFSSEVFSWFKPGGGRT